MLSYLQDRRKARSGGEEGLTLVEVLVAITVLAIIMAPLVLAFTSSLTTADVSETEYRNAASRDRLGTWLSRDAASVDAAGVSISPTRACQTAAQPSGDTLLVTFTSTEVDTSGNYTSSRASYWITGVGKDISLVRRHCTNVPLNVASPTTGEETEILVRVGESTSTSHAAVVHGPVVGGSVRSNPCDEFECTVVVEGSANFQATAQRRVFGAGVPLEINRMYSTSALLGADPPTTAEKVQQERNQVTHVSLSGSTVAEHVWPAKLSLAPGIDPAPVMQVQFRVQSRYTTGGTQQADAEARYLQSDGTTWAAGDAWVNGSYDTTTQQWMLPFDLGKVERAGEYRVWTRLVPDGEPPKEYGGTDPTSSGFPLWFDWKVEDSVFVDAQSGNDAAGRGLRPDQPVATLSRALTVAYSGSRPEIHLRSAGTVAAATATAGSNLRSNTSIIGGYSATWKRGAVDAAAGSGALTRITGPSAGSTAGQGLALTGSATGLRLRQLELLSGTTTTASRSAFGLRVLNGARTTVEHSSITASPGTAGANGVNGAIGFTGCLGQQGYEKNNSQNQRFAPPPEYVDGVYIGPVPANCNSTLRGGYGGAGGDGSNGGRPGTNGLGTSPGNGGPGKASQNCVGGGVDNTSPGNGGISGNPTGDPLPGSSGFGGGKGTNKAVFGDVWQSADGQTGQKGTSGSGGGGSGGGGARYCLGTANGGQGASGGHGGVGGDPGTGGQGGGGSFAVYANGTGTAVNLVKTTVAAGSGGKGGNGGNGGRGGAGGAGGNGNTQDKGGNTSGAGGGSGGGGGGAGGGGQGGWSVAILYTGGVTISRDTDTSLTRGTPGAAGSAGSVGQGGRGGAGGLGVSHSILWGLINWSTNPAANGGNGPAGTGTSSGNAAMPGDPGEGCRVLTYQGGVATCEVP